MRDERRTTANRFVRFDLTAVRHGDGSSITQVTAPPKPLRYGLLKRFTDRRNAGQDGRSRCPEYTEPPEPSPYIKGLVAWFVQQAAEERERRDRDTEPWRQALDGVIADVQTLQSLPTSDPALDAWRRQRLFRMKRQLETSIASREKQCMDRQNQLSAHAWIRIETYWGRLVQVHPEGELMNGWINEWRPSQLAGHLHKLIELNVPHRGGQSDEATDPSEMD
jgi:hypothetical protein